MLRRRASLLVLLGISGGLCGHGATSAQESDALLQRELDALFDPWNDEAPKDRLGKAIESCERRLAAKNDTVTRLLLARLRLARGEPEGALKDAEGAVAAAAEPKLLSP